MQSECIECTRALTTRIPGTNNTYPVTIHKHQIHSHCPACTVECLTNKCHYCTYMSAQTCTHTCTHLTPCALAATAPQPTATILMHWHLMINAMTTRTPACYPWSPHAYRLGRDTDPPPFSGWKHELSTLGSSNFESPLRHWPMQTVTIASATGGQLDILSLR